jgi:hypothetical protein
MPSPPDPSTAVSRTKVKAPATLTVTLSAERPVLQSITDTRDPWKVLQQGLCAAVRVAQCNDPRWALEAGRFLVEYAVNELRLRHEQAREAKERARNQPQALPAPVDRDQVISELRGLYAKALGQSSLILEAETEEPPTPTKP